MQVRKLSDVPSGIVYIACRQMAWVASYNELVAISEVPDTRKSANHTSISYSYLLITAIAQLES